MTQAVHIQPLSSETVHAERLIASVHDNVGLHVRLTQLQGWSAGAGVIRSSSGADQLRLLRLRAGIGVDTDAAYSRTGNKFEGLYNYIV